MFSRKLAVYSQNTFFQEHLWMAPSEINTKIKLILAHVFQMSVLDVNKRNNKPHSTVFIALLREYFNCQCVSRSSHPKVFFVKGVLKICSKFTGQHPWQSAISAISIKLQSNFYEILFRHGCSPVNLPDIFRTPFTKNTFGWLLLCIVAVISIFRIIRRRSRLKMFSKIDVLKNFVIIAGKHLCWSLFVIKLQG